MPSITISPLNTLLISQIKRKVEGQLKTIQAYRAQKWFGYVYDEVQKNKQWNRVFLGIKVFDTDFNAVEQDLSSESCYGSFVYRTIQDTYLYEEEILRGILQAIEYVPYGTALELTGDDLRVLNDEHILDRNNRS